MDKVPYTHVIGQKEAEASNVSVRSRARGDEGVMPADYLRHLATDRGRSRALPRQEESLSLTQSRRERGG